METPLNFLIAFLSANWLIFLNQRAHAQKSRFVRKLSGVLKRRALVWYFVKKLLLFHPWKPPSLLWLVPAMHQKIERAYKVE